MVPIIISYDCADHDPIELWEPEDPLNVDFWMNFTIGFDKKGGDNYQLHVITSNINSSERVNYAIVLNSYNFESVLEEVQKILNDCHGQDWDEISKKLAKHMSWEFENYQPYTGPH